MTSMRRAFMLLGIIELARGDPAQAVALAEKAAAFAPNDPDINADWVRC